MEEEYYDDDPEGTSRALVANLHQGHFIVIKGYPSKVEEVTTKPFGKKGKTNVLIKARDMFTGKIYEEVYPSTHKALIPKVELLQHLGIEIIGDMIRFRDCETSQDRELYLPEDTEAVNLIKEFLEKYEEPMIKVIRCMGIEKVLGVVTNI